jgi:hypothetical protein
MRRFILWTLQAALGSADLIVAGVPLPAVVMVRAWSDIAPMLRRRI